MTQSLAGERVTEMACDPAFAQSGVHWNWGNRQRPGAVGFAPSLSAAAQDDSRAARLWSLDAGLVGD